MKIAVLALLLGTASTGAAPANPTVAALTHATLSRTDTAFLPKAVMNSTFEVQAAHLALQLSTSIATRAYAQKMLSGHTQLGADLAAALQRTHANFSWPSGVCALEQRRLNALRHAGHQLDRVYQAEMIKSHAETYTLFRAYVTSRRASPNIKAVIMSALPMIKTHGDLALNWPKP